MGDFGNVKGQVGVVDMSGFRSLCQQWYVFVLSLFMATTLVACDGSKTQKGRGPTPSSTAPIAILGIAVDKPLALPQCKMSDIVLVAGSPAWQGAYQGSITCYVEITLSKEEEAEMAKVVDPVFRTRRGYRVYTPAGSAPYYINEIILSTLHNKVAEIAIDTTGSDGQESAFSDLKTKFGDPSDVQRDSQTAGIDANWLILPQNVAVNFEGISRGRDTGHITLHNQDFIEAEREYSSRHPAPHL